MNCWHRLGSREAFVAGDVLAEGQRGLAER